MTEPTASPDTDGGRMPVGSWGHVGLAVGADGSARCHTYPHERPILTVDAGHIDLSLSVSGGTVTADHLVFARALVRAATDYLSACERLLAGRTADDSTSDTTTAA
ncbi:MULTISPECIES: hypothetical protein [Protofrankia]|nr:MULTISPECIES: hypothetical protein [Protofrankia]